MKNRFYIFLIFFSVALMSCDKETVYYKGMSPEYIPSTDFSLIKSVPPRPFEDLGKIVYVNDYIFVNEKWKGIHVIDNKIPEKAKSIRFFEIPGNTEFTVKGTILYADNSVHLLVIDISDINNIKVLNYIENLYLDTPVKNPVPPDYKGYFECVDKSKGIFTNKWEQKLLEDPQCETF